MLDLHSFHVSRSEELDKAFKVRITQLVRQNGAIQSVAYHMLTSRADKYVQNGGLDEFVITKSGHSEVAAPGQSS